MVFEVKNKRLKMSPGGMVSLPVSARKALGMKVGQAAWLAIKVSADGVELVGSDVERADLVKVSKRGQVALTGAARDYLGKALKRHYWLHLNDARHTATLKAY